MLFVICIHDQENMRADSALLDDIPLNYVYHEQKAGNYSA